MSPDSDSREERARKERERASIIALKVDGLFHTNPGRWHDQWVKAEAEAVDWDARDQEARRKRLDALDAHKATMGTRESELEDFKAAVKAWKTGEGRTRKHIRDLLAGMPPKAAIDPECWPRPTPSLAVQYLILAVFHDTVLPKGSARIMDARTAESEAVDYIKVWNFGEGATPPSFKDLPDEVFDGEFWLRLGCDGLDRVETYLGDVGADLAKGEGAGGEPTVVGGTWKWSWLIGIRIAIGLAVLIVLELLVVLGAWHWSQGDNLWQKCLNSWPYFVAIFVAWSFLLRAILGKEIWLHLKFWKGDA